MSWLSAIASVHVFEPVFSVEFEAWFEIAVINDNIGAVVTVILKVMNGLLDFLQSAVQVFNTLSDVLKFKFIS